MEWRIYLRYKNVAYRAFKIKQGAGSDIIIIPKNTVYLSKKVLKGLDVGDNIEVRHRYLRDSVDHYTAHARTGQRHVKIELEKFATEPQIGHSFKDIKNVIPLLTMVAGVNKNSKETPSKGKWFGYNLPDDVNYVIIDLYAIPKNVNFQYVNEGTIKNDRKSKESLDVKVIEMRNCSVVMSVRTTNHNLMDINKNVIFQQTEGRTINILRVEKRVILAQVAEISTGVMKKEKR